LKEKERNIKEKGKRKLGRYKREKGNKGRK
jgi:hypothetical protein